MVNRIVFASGKRAQSMKHVSSITIRQNLREKSRGRLFTSFGVIMCAVGANGATPASAKREGDGRTPLGGYRITRVHYRADRLRRPLTSLPLRRISREDGWCDQAGHGSYNRLVKLPFPAGHEQLWRSDHIYDVIVELDHNARPRAQGLGSAIFMHLARDGFTPTRGCIALSRRDMLLLLRRLSTRTRVLIS